MKEQCHLGTGAADRDAIRRASPEDAKAYLELFEAIAASTDYLGFEAGERTTTIESQAGIFERQPQTGDIHLLAWVDGELAGFLSLLRHNRRKSRHIGALVMGVHPRAQGRSLGARLCETAFDEARQEGMRRLELTVVTENARACRLYRSQGFEVEGLRRASLNCAGRLLDEHYMGRML